MDMGEKDLSSNRMDFSLLRCLRAEMPSILAKYPVLLAYLYGSVAEGSSTPTSDVDIGLVFEPTARLSPYEQMDQELRIAAEIEDRLAINEADVRRIDDAPLPVQGKVVTEGILLYCTPEMKSSESDTKSTLGSSILISYPWKR